ncbi:hypothetical protein LOD99_5323 [Oopsacas minuta]|uniref:Mos1 transposase HTH domain-containing protein n=1 Tax=Oopsacas minuta TaxID=111878 RepID=A0AAV7JSI2_9METZ|nr:hypothetical protein LOD99_5323 [Oopsacas minuta]
MEGGPAMSEGEPVGPAYSWNSSSIFILFNQHNFRPRNSTTVAVIIKVGRKYDKKCAAVTCSQFIPTVQFMASKDDNFNLKWQAYIEFRTILKIQLVQIFSELQDILCVDCPSRSTVERWASRFRSGDADVTDFPRSGRPVSATTSENIALIQSMVMEDKCILSIS